MYDRLLETFQLKYWPFGIIENSNENAANGFVQRNYEGVVNEEFFDSKARQHAVPDIVSAHK